MPVSLLHLHRANLPGMDAHMTPVRKASTERILDVARDIGIVEGIEGIGVRSVARHADISPSLVSYHFKGRDALLSALLQHVMEEHYRDLSILLHKTAVLPDHLLSPASFFSSALALLAHEARPRTVLLLELYLQVALAGHPVDPAAAEGFWQQAAETLSIPDALQWPWALASGSALWYAILDEDPIVSQVWIARAFYRLAARLEGLPDHPAPEMPTKAPLENDEPSATVRKGRAARSLEVTEAAIRLLSRGEKITHRTIAKEAGIPHSFTTYLFDGKSDILSDAYKVIYERMMKEMGTVPDQLFNIPVTVEGKAPPVSALFSRLLLHIARENDNPVLAERFRNTRGRRSQLTLNKLGFAADPLDGVIWSLCQGPYSPAILGLPPAERAAHIHAGLTRLAERLFGKPSG